MSWAAAPPSDQVSNSNGYGPKVWSVALTLMRSPRMIVRLNGALATPRASIDSPGGFEFTVTVDTFGKIDTVLLVFSPPESVTVTVSSRNEGNSWPSVTNEPDLPAHVPDGCSWQPPGQCSMINPHENALAGNVPSSGSVAVAAKFTVSP